MYKLSSSSILPSFKPNASHSSFSTSHNMARQLTYLCSFSPHPRIGLKTHLINSKITTRMIFLRAPCGIQPSAPPPTSPSQSVRMRPRQTTSNTCITHGSNVEIVRASYTRRGRRWGLTISRFISRTESTGRRWRGGLLPLQLMERLMGAVVGERNDILTKSLERGVAV